ERPGRTSLRASGVAARSSSRPRWAAQAGAGRIRRTPNRHSAARDVAIARHMPAPVLVGCATDANTRCRNGIRRRRGAIVDNAEAAGEGDQIDAVLLATDAHGLGQAGRAAAQILIAPRLWPRRTHGLQAAQWC